MTLEWPQAAGAQRWLKGISGTLSSPCRVICFPYAGGSAPIYRRWSDGLDAAAACAALQLPGRSVRTREAPIADMDTLVEALLPVLDQVVDRPTVFFGYSNGALVAFECAVRLASRPAGQWLRHVVVAASRAPQVPPADGRTHQLPDDAFIDYVRWLGGMPQEIAANEELLRYCLPMLRADFAIGELYRGPTSKVIDVPVTAVCGLDDTTTTLAQVGLWRERTRAGFQQVELAGGHFFLEEQHDALMSLLNAMVAQLAGAPHRVEIAL